MKQEQKKHVDRKANLTILGRTLFLMGLFGVVAFVPLFVHLYDLQINQQKDLEAKALEQQTGDLPVSANRGYIYDSKGTALAMSATVHDVFISPKELIECREKYQAEVKSRAEKGKEPLAYPEPTPEFIAENLARILGIEQATILKRMEKTNSQYERLTTRAEKDMYEQVLEFVTTNHISGIYYPPTTKRYYPCSSLASQVIGWVNPNLENRGAYGLEAVYEEVLAGQTGRVVTAQNGKGTQMLYRFDDYYDALDGNNLTITIDQSIQYFCERILEKGIATFDVQDGGFAIAMDPKTGAILAWANSPTYDLNNPWTISDPILSAQAEKIAGDSALTDEEKSAQKTELLYQQWRNKAIVDTYEPGSTWKAMVLAAALEEGVIDENTTFNCTGVITVADWPIKCSKRAPGHGHQTLAQAVANSCNPAFIAIGQKLGAERFYDYMEAFGTIGKTGIDMQGEADNTSLVWPRENFTSIYGLASLATASFGQRFKVTPIQMITAASSVINGGHLMQPYVLQGITDPDGNPIKTTQPTEVRQVVSEETSARCRAILEGVVDGGTGKKAYVPGYRIGGKTGSSETDEDDHTIVSFLGFAPADDPKVVILLAYDNPKPVSPGSNYTANGWYISGGNMAALMAGELMENILDYLGVQKEYTAEEKAAADVVVPKVVGLPAGDAATAVKNQGFTTRTVGTGETVTDQIPAAGAAIPGGSTVVLYLGEAKPTDLVVVPNLVGKTYAEAKSTLAELGLYLKNTSGTSGNAARAATQTTVAGSEVERGTVVSAKFVENDAVGAGAGL